MLQKLFFFIFLLIILATSGICMELNIEKGLWPLYFNDNNSSNFLAPFIQNNTFEKENKFIFRPFFLYDKKKNGDYRFYFLYPIVEFSKTGNNITERIFPFYSKKYKEHKGEKEKFSHFFPFFWGKTVDNRTYGGVFPFYGKLINKFHYNEIKFFIWPLYYTKKRGEDTDYHFLWPFFGRGIGKHYTAFKFWPFFGYKKKENIFERHFFLWPLFIFQKRKIGNHPENWEHKNIYFPFYIHTFTDGNNYNYQTFLFPFFRYNKRGKNYKYYGFPWPFFTYEKDGDYFDFSLFPFIHHEHRERFEKYSFLWIFLRNEKLFSKNRKKLIFKRTSFLLLNRFEHDYKKKTKYSNVWPFYEYFSEGDNYIFKLFEPLPLRIPGVYELYSTFFNIFYIVKHNNMKKISFLWGLFSYDSSEKESSFTFLKLFKFKWDNKKNIEGFDKLSWYISFNIGT